MCHTSIIGYWQNCHISFFAQSFLFVIYFQEVMEINCMHRWLCIQLQYWPKYLYKPCMDALCNISCTLTAGLNACDAAARSTLVGKSVNYKIWAINEYISEAWNVVYSTSNKYIFTPSKTSLVLFYLGFTALSRIFHLNWADCSSMVGKNLTTRRKTTSNSISRTCLSLQQITDSAYPISCPFCSEELKINKTTSIPAIVYPNTVGQIIRYRFSNMSMQLSLQWIPLQ